MKTIISIWNSAGKGKTDTVRETAKTLMQIYPKHKLITPIPTNMLTHDFRLVLEINGKIIGLESQGDPKSNLERRLDELARNYNCDLIFCTARTRGETVGAVNTISNNYNYDIIWTSTYQTIHNHSLVNNLKARHLISLIQNLGLI